MATKEKKSNKKGPMGEKEIKKQIAITEEKIKDVFLQPKVVITRSAHDGSVLHVGPPKKVVFEISYLEDGDTCMVFAKGTKYDVKFTSTNVPPSEALIMDLIRGYLNSRPR